MKTLSALIAALAAVAAVSVLAADPSPSPTPWTHGVFTSMVSSVSASATSNFTSGAVTLRKGKGIVISPEFVGTNASDAALVTFSFQLSLDGTNYTTTAPVSVAASSAGLTAVRCFSNAPPSLIGGAQLIRCSSIVNASTNGITISRVRYALEN